MEPGFPALQPNTRPHKKMRQESTKVANDEHESPRMYFDLCPDSNENIVRCTSSGLNSKYWASFINSEDVYALSNVEGGIGEFITSQCNAISLYEKQRTRDSSGNWIAAYRKDIAFKMHRLEDPAFIPSKFDDKNEQQLHGLYMLKSMTRSSKWKNIETFVFYGDLTIQTVTVIGLFWKQMKTVTFRGFIAPEIAAALALNCTNIRELALVVKRGVLDGLRLWETVGNSLETLRMGIIYSAAEELGEIQKHCRKLRNISISTVDDPGDSTSYASLIASYGEQLEHARIRRMDAKDLEYVVTRCPNALFTFASKETDIPNMKIIGKQLKEVSIYKDIDPNLRRTDFTDTWDLCPNLQHISIHKAVEIFDVRAVFATPKLFLKRLNLRFSNFSTLKVIANKVTTLEDIWFLCDFPPENVFKSLIMNNKSLRKAKVIVQSYDGLPADLGENDTMERVRDLTSCFMSSTDLESLEIDDIPSHPIPGSRSPGYLEPVREMLRSQYRFRRVDVTYFGTRYS